jgi:hypothetical protein
MKSKSDTSLRNRKDDLAGAASIPEARRIRALVNKFKRPLGILSWRAEYRDDATGDPAVWIWFYVKDEGQISERRINELVEFKESVMSKLLESKIDRLPYVGFRNPPVGG